MPWFMTPIAEELFSGMHIGGTSHRLDCFHLLIECLEENGTPCREGKKGRSVPLNRNGSEYCPSRLLRAIADLWAEHGSVSFSAGL